MTAGYELYRAAFKRGGLVEIRDVDDLDRHRQGVSHPQAAGRQPRGRAHALGRRRRAARRPLHRERAAAFRRFPTPPPRKLRKTLVSFASSANPVDATANGYNDNFASYGKAVELVLDRPEHRPGHRAACRAASRPRAWSENLLRDRCAASTKPLHHQLAHRARRQRRRARVPGGERRAVHTRRGARGPCARGADGFRAQAARLSAARQAARSSAPSRARRSTCRRARRRWASTGPSSCSQRYGVPVVGESVAAAGGDRGAARRRPLPSRSRSRSSRPTSRTRPKRAP